MAVPTLYLFDRWDERLGVLPTLGFMTHTEGLGGEDTLEFDCLVTPEKGDRLVWRDPDTGAWREHEVVRTDEETAGIAHVYAESSLCELLRDFVEEEQLVAKTVSQAMAAVVAHTRWSLGTVSCDDSTKRGALLCHSNALAALRRVESVWDGELKYSYEVSDGRISKRTVSLRMSATTEVVGFQYLSGMTTAKQCFVSRTDLESVYATSFDTSALTAGYQMFYGCQKLVGGTDGTVVGNLTVYSIYRLGEGGVLTDPGNDTRQWFWGTVYADGCLEISASSDVTWSRGRGARAGRAQAKYQLASGLPWSDEKDRFTKVKVKADMATARFTELNMNYWFYAYGDVTSFEGLGNLRSVSRMRHAFSSCTAVTELDLTGFDPSSLTDLFYAFAGCSALTTIYVDADWTLPSGCTGNQCFYSCKSLVGGNGTARASEKTGVAYCVVGKDGQAGYLTAKA